MNLVQTTVQPGPEKWVFVTKFEGLFNQNGERSFRLQWPDLVGPLGDIGVTVQI